MRLFLSALLLLSLAGCATSSREAAESIRIDDIRPRYIAESEFMRIGEYLSGRDITGDRLILRSEPEARSGYYFVLIFDQRVDRLPKGTLLRGEFYTARSPELQTHEFPLPNNRPKTREVFVGLTGEDWPIADAVPGAWRFTLESPNGEVLAQKQSFLWEL